MQFDTYLIINQVVLYVKNAIFESCGFQIYWVSHQIPTLFLGIINTFVYIT